jgi:Papain family cysteine protease
MCGLYSYSTTGSRTVYLYEVHWYTDVRLQFAVTNTTAINNNHVVVHLSCLSYCCISHSLLSKSELISFGTSKTMETMSEDLNTTKSHLLTTVAYSHSNDNDKISTTESVPNYFYPPEKKISIQDTHCRMQRLLPIISPNMLKRLHPLFYDKLSYAIEHDLDQCLPRGIKRIPQLITLLNKSTVIGKRYHALYSARGDDMSELSDMSKHGIDAFDNYLTKHFPEYSDSNNGKVYIVFRDNDHPNMVPFYRIQTQGGNCCLQAPFLLHWYLSLWFDRKKTADDVFRIDLAKFIQRTMTGNYMYDYLFKDAGACSLNVLEKVTGCDNQLRWYQKGQFEEIQAAMKMYGPALVVMCHTHPDFNEKNKKLKYEGVSECNYNYEGHAMVLVGIRKDNADQTFFLLQNFWQKKLFIEVHQDYLMHPSHVNSFTFMEHSFKEVDINHLYSQRTGKNRISVSAAFLERSLHQVLER